MTGTIWLTIDDVKNRTTLPRIEIKRLVEAGSFPKPEQIAAGKLAWRECDIDSWIDTRPIADDLPGMTPKHVN